MNKDDALKDFMERIEHYKVTYQSLDEELEKHLSFMRIFNAGEKVLVHRHEGQEFVYRSFPPANCLLHHILQATFSREWFTT